MRCAVGVELLGGMPRIIGELLNQELVALAELVLGEVFQAQGAFGEVLDEVRQGGIRQQFFVGPVAVSEHASEGGGVGCFDGAHDSARGLANVGGGFAQVLPVGTLGDGEAVVLWQVG